MLPEQEEMVLRVLKDCGIEPSIKPFKSVLDGGIINDQGNEIYAKELPIFLVDQGLTISTEYEFEGKPSVWRRLRDYISSLFINPKITMRSGQVRK